MRMQQNNAIKYLTVKADSKIVPKAGFKWPRVRTLGSRDRQGSQSSSHTSLSLSSEQSGTLWPIVRAGLECGQPDHRAGGKRGYRAYWCSQGPDKQPDIIMLL